MDIDLDFDSFEDIEIPNKKKVLKTKLSYTEVNDSDYFDMIEIPIEKSKKKLNPFEVEDTVVLDISKNPRYELIQNLKKQSEGRISKILNSQFVNVAYWDTLPVVVKNVPIYHLKIKNINIFRKLVFYVKKTVARFFKPKGVK